MTPDIVESNVTERGMEVLEIDNKDEQKMNRIIFSKNPEERLKCGNRYKEIIQKSSRIPPEFIWIPGERNTRKPCIHGYYYHHDFDNKYRCKYHKSFKCQVRVEINGNSFKYTHGNQLTHEDHPCDYYNFVQREIIEKAILDPANAGKSTGQIVESCVIPESTERLSTYKKYGRSIRGTVSNPETFEQIVLSEDNKKNCLFFDEDFLLLGDRELFWVLEETPMIFIDGTFKICPSLFFFLL